LRFPEREYQDGDDKRYQPRQEAEQSNFKYFFMVITPVYGMEFRYR
jgi:hypothetical protein